jgi:hypothetical protein
MMEHYLGEQVPEPVTIAASFRAPTVDGHRVRRVVCLPFRGEAVHPEQADTIYAAFCDALHSRRAFEIVTTRRDVLTEDEVERWSAAGEMSRETILAIAKRHQADGLLYGTITRYRPYEPMALGLRVSLVSAGAGDLVWEADGLFDTQDARVTQDLHNWYANRVSDRDRLDDWRSVLLSPARFTTYVCARVTETW